MTTPDPADDHRPVRDLLRSLQASLLRLRNEAEGLHDSLMQNGAVALTQGERQQVAKLESLIRDSQKVEKLIAERTHDTAAGDAELDLEEARAEICRRLDCLRAAAVAEPPSGGTE